MRLMWASRFPRYPVDTLDVDRSRRMGKSLQRLHSQTAEGFIHQWGGPISKPIQVPNTDRTRARCCRRMGSNLFVFLDEVEVNLSTISSRMSSSATRPRRHPYSSTTIPGRFFWRWWRSWVFSGVFGYEVGRVGRFPCCRFGRPLSNTRLPRIRKTPSVWLMSSRR